jgi:hypothetical protein
MILKLENSNAYNKLSICKAIKTACGIGLREAQNLTDLLYTNGSIDLKVCVTELRAGIPLDNDIVTQTFKNIENVVLVNDIEERNIKLIELLTILKLIPTNEKSLLTYYFSEIKFKDISLETGFCYISGKNTEGNDLDVYFSLNNYTIIC